jgi:hypothetical protein
LGSAFGVALVDEADRDSVWTGVLINSVIEGVLEEVELSIVVDSSVIVVDSSVIVIDQSVVITDSSVVVVDSSMIVIESSAMVSDSELGSLGT